MLRRIGTPGAGVRLALGSTRSLSASTSVLRHMPPKPKKVPKVVTPGAATKPAKVKKAGATHLPFRDAVREMGVEKLAVDLRSLGINSLSPETPLGQVVQYDTEAEKILATLKSFKKYQHHEIFRNPVSLVSSNTVSIRDNFLANLNNTSAANRVCLTGERGSGKSTLITQAHALALAQHNQDVVLLHIPEAELIINGTSDYIHNKKLDKYQQPMLTKRWIQQLRTANEAVFKKLPLSRDVSFVTKKKEFNLKKDKDTVYDYILHNHEFGKVGPTGAFQFFIEELIHHSEKVPVLFSVDNINALTAKPLSKYFHPDFTPIHFTEFEIGNFIQQVISGELSFKNGGVLLAESSGFATSNTLPVGLGLKQYDPYWKQQECDIDVANAFLSNGGVKAYPLASFTPAETRSLLEVYQRAGALELRAYPVKSDLKSAEDIINERTIKKAFESGANQGTIFDQIVKNAFTVSCGKPGYILQDVKISY